VLQPVQGRLAGERRAIRAFGLQLPGQRRQHRIVAQLLVIDEVFITESDGEHPLADQRRQPVLDQVAAAIIAKTGSEPIDKPDRLLRGAQQQRAGVRRHPPGVERGDDPAAFGGSKIEAFRGTLCRHRGNLSAGPKYLRKQRLLPLRHLDAHAPREKSGLSRLSYPR
jgi:hypothetical protein